MSPFPDLNTTYSHTVEPQLPQPMYYAGSQFTKLITRIHSESLLCFFLNMRLQATFGYKRPSVLQGPNRRQKNVCTQTHVDGFSFGKGTSFKCICHFTVSFLIRQCVICVILTSKVLINPTSGQDRTSLHELSCLGFGQKGLSGFLCSSLQQSSFKHIM